MSPNSYSSSHQHALLLSSLTRHQQELIKDYIVDINNRFNKVFLSFDSLNLEFSFGNKIINTFSNYFFLSI